MPSPGYLHPRDIVAPKIDIVEVHKKLLEIPYDIDHLIIVPRLGVGGNEKVVSCIYDISHELGHTPKILVTDTPIQEDSWGVYPDIFVLEDIFPGITKRDINFRLSNLLSLIKFVAPKKVTIAASNLAHHLLIDGVLKKSDLEIEYTLYSQPVDKNGLPVGYYIDLPLIEPNVTTFLTDNNLMKQYLIDQAIDPSNIKVLPIPVTQVARKNLDPSDDIILWASRMDFEKRPEFMLEIVRNAPHLKFRIYGEAVLDTTDYTKALSLLPNVDYRGVFQSFGEIDLTNVGTFLYTSKFDGRPNIVLEAMFAGLAIVANDVGDLYSFLDKTRGHLLPIDATAQDFIAQIDSLCSNPTRRKLLGQNCHDFVRQHHTSDAFKTAYMLNLASQDPSYDLRQNTANGQLL